MKILLSAVLSIVVLAGAGALWINHVQENDLVVDAHAKFDVLEKQIRDFQYETSICVSYAGANAFERRLQDATRQASADADVAMAKVTDRLGGSDERWQKLSQTERNVSGVRNTVVMACQQQWSDLLDRTGAFAQRAVRPVVKDKEFFAAKPPAQNEQLRKEIAVYEADQAQHAKAAQELHNKIEEAQRQRAPQSGQSPTVIQSRSNPVTIVQPSQRN